MAQRLSFKVIKRQIECNEPVDTRVKSHKEFTISLDEERLQNQSSRCMDCGIPFCHSGCPLGNLIPEFNELVYKGEWQKALRILHSTNNFPEFTGRLCPAPCEKSCVLGIIDQPVSIENIEKSIVERGFKEGWIVASPPKTRTGKTIVVVGSGPAGLAAAQQLNRAGHTVTVLERDDAIGGLLRYGIPSFKLEKGIIDRRVSILEEEGIFFKTNTNVGVNYDVSELDNYDAIVLCGGATVSRSLPVAGISSQGVVQAMDFLTQQTRQLFGKKINGEVINAKGKNVIVIGGGDTGSDCIGTCNRQGAKSVTSFEIMPKPPVGRSEKTPWPFWPIQLTTSSSHEEGCDRNWLMNTKEFVTNEQGALIALKTVEVEWLIKYGETPQLVEKPNTEKSWDCELALLALGFTGPEDTLSNELNLELDKSSNYKSDTNHQTSNPKIFTAGDMRKGQSLIVWAISEGREVARSVDVYLMGSTSLPTKGAGDLIGV
ncbi:MAG TPA: glutamate synthase subunit beta [Flavobacteriales bacterium]|nr:glutamate synthase subunit beta [Flavobacteriales bacterium]HIO59469.1 glutamate synthase subunit beta [Flavobacteriales bacterium]